MSKSVNRIFLILLLLLSFSLMSAGAETAVDIAEKCTLKASANHKNAWRVRNARIDSHWDALENGTLTVTLPKGKQAQGVMISFFCEAPHVVVYDEDGSLLAEWDDGFYNAWIPFSRPSGKFTIKRAEKEDLVISRLRVLTPGELPSWVQQWKRLEGDADLLLIATHPDDDLLWFGGMLPTYAGERKMKVQVAYMVGGRHRVRRIELLNALWHCGVRYYPEIGPFGDGGLGHMNTAYEYWGGEDQVDLHITRLLRKWNPKVIAAQDLEGEYGHMHHRITSKAIVKAVTSLCGNEAYDPDSIAQYGAAHPQKLYIHLYDQNQVEYDWEKPLAAFGGKTGLEIAREAFKFHVSQQSGKYHVSTKNAYNCELFGLYYTTVGQDAEGKDMFENVQ